MFRLWLCKRSASLWTMGDPDNRGESQQDEMVGDFLTVGGESVVLSCHMLPRLPATSVAPLVSELLGEEGNDDVE